MHAFRFLIRASLALVWIMTGLFHVALVYPLLGLSARHYSKKCWSKVLLNICGVRVKQAGHAVLEGPVLFVVNHVSWIDIFILNCARATAFIAKSEIRKWPLIGWLANGADTIFIERASRHAVHKVGESMRQHFEQNQAVGLFPEGTTSTGYTLLPFYANLFEPARKAGACIQPVVLKYYHHGRRSDFAAFVGEQTLLHNMWCVLGGTGTTVEMIFLPIIWDGDGQAPVRAELSRTAHQVMGQTLAS